MAALDLISIAFDNWLRTEDSPRPFVTLCYAQSLDGSIAVTQGKPSAISSPESLKHTHALRAFHDAILVGIGTVLSDDPQLTARGVPGEQPQPIVLDSRLRFPENARLLAHPKPPWIMTGLEIDSPKANRLKRQGCKVVSTELKIDNTTIHHALQSADEQGLRHVMVEGGAEVITSFLNIGLVDYAVITLSPRYLGGYNLIREELFSKDNGVPQIDNPSIHKLGADIIIEGPVNSGSTR
jgi:3,4-dihydroxy 2-butanone 4-phosphate synthase/GTP cyclohydrolase II